MRSSHFMFWLFLVLCCSWCCVVLAGIVLCRSTGLSISRNWISSPDVNSCSRQAEMQPTRHSPASARVCIFSWQQRLQVLLSLAILQTRSAAILQLYSSYIPATLASFPPALLQLSPSSPPSTPSSFPPASLQLFSGYLPGFHPAFLPLPAS